MNRGYGRRTCVLVPDSEYILHPGSCCPSPARCCHPAGVITVFKRPFHWLSSQPLQGIVDIIRADSLSTNPLSCSICCKISSLPGSNALGSLTMVKNVCPKSTRGGCAVSIVIREGIFISAGGVHSSEIKALPLLPPGNWLTSPLPPGNCLSGNPVLFSQSAD